jgi:DHA1 family bicyclomycin/chloramphenicol resistance-like MFS transporter
MNIATDLRVRLVFIFGALTGLGPLAVDAYLPAFPVLAREFGVDPASVQGTLSTFFLGMGVGHLFYGPLSDRYGRRGPVLFGLTLFILASIACALAPHIESFWIARLAQSLGACAGLMVSRAAVRDLYDGAEMARFFSLLVLVLGVAPIVGPLLGGWILAFAGWREIFWMLALVGAILLIVVGMWMPETLPPERRVAGGLKPALASYRELLGDGHYMAHIVAASLVFTGLFAYIAGSPFVFINYYGVSPQAYALFFGANAVGLVAASQINAQLLLRYSPQSLLLFWLSVYLAAAVVLLVCVLAGFGGVWGIAIPLFVTVSMVGAAPANALALALHPYPHKAGSATALFGALQFGSGAVMAVLEGVLHMNNALPMAVLILLTAVVALLVNRLGGTERD